MMVIDIRKLNAQKKYSGHLEFSYDAPETLIEIPFVTFSAPVEVKFDYELYEDDSLEVRGTVAYRIEGKCSRCLKDAAQEVEGELDALFEPHKNGEDYACANGIVDLKNAVDDSIMASMPFALSCGEECEGLEYSDEPSK